MTKAQDYQIFKKVADVIGEERAEKEIQAVIDSGIYIAEPIVNDIKRMFTWKHSPQGSNFWVDIYSGKDPEPVMANQTMKLVWRENTGLKYPADDSGIIVLYRNGKLSSKPQSFHSVGFDFSMQGLWDDITAYQTTRTKAAKYERVGCGVCDGKGTRKLKDWVTKATFIGICICCNGKGYTLEAIK